MRDAFLPFAKPDIAEDAVAAVAQCLRSGWLTTGPRAIEFEEVFKTYTGAKYALAVNSATAGLHGAFSALGLKKGDEVITSPMTFAATLNTIIFAGATPVLADIDPRGLNILPAEIEKKITPRTKAIAPVHFAGRPCDMAAIEAIAKKHNLWIIEDAAHALGAAAGGQKIGKPGVKKAAVFSFHPTKNITTGEGGIVCVDDDNMAEFIYVFRLHGMSKGAGNRYAAKGKAHYDILMPGLKYNMLDMQAVIGLSQMKRLEAFNARRAQIAAKYMQAFKDVEGLILPPPVKAGDTHSWHIFTPLIDIDKLKITRDEFMKLMGAQNIGTALHYQAAHLFSSYQKAYGWKRGDCPNAEYAASRIVSLPLFPAMEERDIQDTIKAAKEILKANKR
ncbi:MAG: DegT/DnrJ/EryC1/StrS aminotransferase family protein [Elusimicrobiota bacterium]|jgi:dTDP-4-amino-4,6-dideoxygalactose transaminase|nr:DegT/DnrJ/EryC1/StrS aminotransferase family protein [Elusimicrobiota bacterium]